MRLLSVSLTLLNMVIEPTEYHIINLKGLTVSLTVPPHLAISLGHMDF